MAYLLIILLILAHVAAYFLWQRFTRHEVAVNAEMITANGSADDLRAGFHQRRTWVRFWPWLGLSVAGALPLWGHWPAAGLGFVSLGILLTGFFARYFTPWLNVAMKLDYKPEFYASPDSASWPDAAIWKELRAGQPMWGDGALQAEANATLKSLLTRTWLAARILYAAGMLAALLLLSLHY